MYQWDEAKRAANLAKHGVDFAEAYAAEDRPLATLSQVVGGEVRFLSYVTIRGRLHALVWTPREGATRVISLRRANQREVARYGKAEGSD